jgi:hypothetical protein
MPEFCEIARVRQPPTSRNPPLEGQNPLFGGVFGHLIGKRCVIFAGQREIYTRSSACGSRMSANVACVAEAEAGGAVSLVVVGVVSMTSASVMGRVTDGV